MNADLGPCASLCGESLLPLWSVWNRDVSADPVDPRSATLLTSIGLDKPLHPDFGTTWNGAPIGIPYMVVKGDQPRVPVGFTYSGESDAGPYPIPPDVPVEGGTNSTGDRHVIVLDRDHGELYELYNAKPVGANWQADAGAVFDLTTGADRPAGWTSADGAGLPILPGLVRYDEVIGRREINHALRFTVRRTRRAYVYPARHFASSLSDIALPPMGMRLRLKGSVDLASYPPECRVILTALKRYGMFLADNGGDLYLSGAPDPRWNDSMLGLLSGIKARDFDVIQMPPIQV